MTINHLGKCGQMTKSLGGYNGKRVLVTGHTGFKGSWLTIWLKTLGAEVIGVALDPDSEDSIFVKSEIGSQITDYRQDIRSLESLTKIFVKEKPDIVFHLAAQPLVLESYTNPIYTIETNTMGTLHVLEAIRSTSSVKGAVMVTTDKCYLNKEWYHAYREIDPLGGHDPYSSSKAAAEILISSYRNSFFSETHQANIASARAGNVIGGGDWASNRLIPDVFRSIEENQKLEIRSPTAVRPWQHVLEPLYGYLILGLQLINNHSQFDEAWNFGPYQNNVLTVKELLDQFVKVVDSLNWEDVSDQDHKHEANLLMLDINKAIVRLGWKPLLTTMEMVRLTADWYLNYRNRNVMALCQEQIQYFQSLKDNFPP